MSEKYFPFDSINKDRVYSSTDWVAYLGQFLSDGLVHDNGIPGLDIVSTLNFGITFSPGGAFIKGRQYILEEEYQLILPASDANSYRIDYIVLRLDNRITERNIKLAIKKGIPCDTREEAVPQELERNDSIWELGLYQITSSPQQKEINPSDIKDVRGNLDCCTLSNIRAFGDSTIYKGSETPSEKYTKKYDLWIDI